MTVVRKLSLLCLSIILQLLFSNSLKASGFLQPAASDLIDYRKPNLTWVSVSTISVEANTQTANQTKLVFPGGGAKTVTEASGGLNKFRIADLAQAAVFRSCGSGAERSGLIQTLTRSASTFYEVYGVKSQCTGGGDNFVTVVTTWEPTLNYFSILNSSFGTNGWVYIGTVRNGDNYNNNNTTNTLRFIQRGNVTRFTNAGSGGTGVSNKSGYNLATTLGTTAVFYNYTNTSSSNSFPSHIKVVFLQVDYSGSCGTGINVRDAGDNLTYFQFSSANVGATIAPWLVNLDYFDLSQNGVNVNSSSACNMSLVITGFVDDALGLTLTP